MNARTLSTFAATALLTTATLATAQAQPNAAPEPAAVSASASPNVDQGVVDDANSGRVWFTPTALTNPAGSWSVHNHELVVIGAGFSPTDKLQLSVSTLFPVSSDMPFVGLATAKYQLVRAGRLRLAAHLSITHVSDDDEYATVGTGGGAASYCLNDDCSSLVNGYLGAGFATEDGGDTTPIFASAGVVLKVASRVRLVGEVTTGFIADEFETIDGALLGYGVRFTSKHIGVDFGAIKNICEGCSDEDLFPLGIPWLSVTYRDGPSL